jgi:hypothetical protein
VRRRRAEHVCHAVPPLRYTHDTHTHPSLTALGSLTFAQAALGSRQEQQQWRRPAERGDDSSSGAVGSCCERNLWDQGQGDGCSAVCGRAGGLAMERVAPSAVARVLCRSGQATKLSSEWPHSS